MPTESNSSMIRKVVKVTTCNVQKAKGLFDELVVNGLELKGHQIVVTHLENSNATNRFALSCRIWGQNEAKVNEKAREIGDSMLAYCILKNVGCSNICLVNETGKFVEGRKWVKCDHLFVDNDDQALENKLASQCQ